MFAVISYKGNQYKVEPDKQYEVDLLELEKDQKEITFSDILLFNDDKITVVGAPTVAGASVSAVIVGETRSDKVRVFKFRAKKRYQRQHNHRQDYSVIKVVKININEKQTAK